MPRRHFQLAVLVLSAIGVFALLAWRDIPRVAAVAVDTNAPTFYRDVLPILTQHCQSCHRPGEIGSLPLMTYEQARIGARSIAFITASRKMPPWFADPSVGHFANDPS